MTRSGSFIGTIFNSGQFQARAQDTKLHITTNVTLQSHP